jgi:predicted outer membrane protein
MSASFSWRFGVGVATLSCLLIGYAAAQQGTAGNSQPGSSGSSSSASDASGSGARQSGRSSAAQSGQGTSQSYGQSARSHTANYGATASASGSNSEVQQFMANCLLAENEAEVQLTQLAEQQAQSSSVKQFAQKMAQDHRQMIQQLQQVAGTQGSSSSSLGASGSTSATSSGTSGSSSLGTSGTNSAGTTTSGISGVGAGTSDSSGTAGTSGTSGLSGTSGSGTSSASALPGSSAASGTASSGRSSLSSSQTTDLAGGVASATSGGAVQQLGQLERQILDRKMQLTKEDLQQKQGAEFDKCFIGTVIPAHVHAVAQLEVLEKQGGQLAQIAQQARPIVQQHLDHAKQLMRQLDNQSGNSGSQAERSSTRRER